MNVKSLLIGRLPPKVLPGQAWASAIDSMAYGISTLSASLCIGTR